MPKVVIELQANTQEAVNKIQQFARAQKDAFDAVKAGNPALEDASVKVSKLTENTKGAAQVTGEFNRAAKNLAQGGIRELAGGVPVVGDALTSLAGTLKGFPAIMLGVVGTGAAFIAYLKQVQAEAGKTAASIEKMSAGIQSQTLALQARVGGIRAGAAGRPEQAAVADFRATEIEANAARDEAIQAAAQKRAGAISVTDRLMGLLNPQALLDKAKLADAEYQTARAKAEADANAKIVIAREQLTATLQGIEAGLDAEIAAAAAARVAAETPVQAAIQATIDKTAELGPAILASAEAAVSAGELWMQSLMGISASLDQIIAKSRAVGGGGGGAATIGVGGGTGATGVAGLDQTVLGGIVNQPGGGLTPFNAAYDPILGPGQGSGTSRGTGPGQSLNPNPAALAGDRPQATRETISLTVNQTGTVISQDRDWATLVETLDQSLRARR